MPNDQSHTMSQQGHNVKSNDQWHTMLQKDHNVTSNDECHTMSQQGHTLMPMINGIQCHNKIIL